MFATHIKSLNEDNAGKINYIILTQLKLNFLGNWNKRKTLVWNL